MKSVRTVSQGYASGSLSPLDFVGKTLARIEGEGAALNCFITVLHESALKQAAESEARYRAGSPLGPIDGVPVAVKDIMYVKGVRCTAGSRLLAANVATYDSPVVARLKDAGAVLVGTTNLHEFAAGITGTNPHFGPVRNPWDSERISGGSSSGSAAAVAAGLAVAALGTDTAGSVRVPAALCGVVGLKPTYGRVSRLGVIPLASSFDTVGTLTSCAWDAAALLNVLSGHIAEDLSTVTTEATDFASALDQDHGPQKVGVPRKHFQDGLAPEVADCFSKFIDRLTAVGCTVQSVELEGIEKVYSCWQTIRLAEAAAFHVRWLESSPELYGEDVRSSLEEGMGVKAVDYVNAQNLRPSIMQSFSSSMSGVDAIAVPATQIAAPKIGEETVDVGGRQIGVRQALISLTLPFNLVGYPAISVPAGQAHGLPVGAQLAAGPFEEAKLLQLAASLEGSAPYPDPPRALSA